jgi:hypothetical protein
MARPEQVADWMKQEFERDGELLQAHAVEGIKENFGAEWLEPNRHGNLGIKDDVLKVFLKLLPKEKAVWEGPPSARWRLREEGDGPGREARPKATNSDDPVLAAFPILPR